MADKPWSTAADVRVALDKAWSSGAVLRELHLPTAPPVTLSAESDLDAAELTTDVLEPDALDEVPELDIDVRPGELAVPLTPRRVFPLRLRLVRPSRTDLTSRFAEVGAWVRAVRADVDRGGWRLETRTVSAGVLGRQDVPVAVWVDTPEQALASLGPSARRTADVLAHLLALSEIDSPVGSAARTLALSRPHDVLAAAADWPALLALTGWLLEHPRPAIHIRQVPVDGVHTKLVEQNRPLLTRLCDLSLPETHRDSTQSVFEHRYGFATKPRRVELRAAADVLGVPGCLEAAVTWPVDGVAALDPDVYKITEVLVCENHLSFLTVPLTPGRLVIFGNGNEAADLLNTVPWLPRVNLRYWGDIDTFGLLILDRVRRVAPHAVSVLMDRETLLAHRSAWGREPTPTVEAPETLTALTTDERLLYASLQRNELGDQLRFEQEFARFDLVEQTLGTGGRPWL